MGRNRDNAPVAITCPKIDRVISFLENIDWDENEIDLLDECKKTVIVMEDIRTANASLREWGNDLCVERDELSDERDELRDERDELRDEVERLNDQINDLNNEVIRLENIVDY